jgi:hypothetical protein
VKARELLALLGLVKKLDDSVLDSVATLPRYMMGDDYVDRVIVWVARGEVEWREECLK